MVNKIVFDREELVAALVAVAPAVGGGRFSAVDKAVRFDVMGEECVITANNGGVQIQQGISCKSNKAVEFCIEHDILIKTARLISDVQLTLELSDHKAKIVISKSQSYEVNLEVNSDFSVMEMKTEVSPLQVNINALSKAVKAATPLISFAPTMLQYLYLSFNSDRGLLSIIGGSNLGVSTQQVDCLGKEDCEFMVQRSFANLLQSVNGDGDIFISSDGSKAQYNIESLNVISSLPEGNYPIKIVREGIKACGDAYLLFEKAEMLNALRRLNVFASVERELADKSLIYEPILQFEIKGDEISFKAEDKMSSRKGKEALEISNGKEIELSAAVKATTLIKVLANLNGKDVRLHTNESKTMLYLGPDLDKAERKQFWIISLYNL